MKIVYSVRPESSSSDGRSGNWSHICRTVLARVKMVVISSFLVFISQCNLLLALAFGSLLPLGVGCNKLHSSRPPSSSQVSNASCIYMQTLPRELELLYCFDRRIHSDHQAVPCSDIHTSTRFSVGHCISRRAEVWQSIYKYLLWGEYKYISLILYREPATVSSSSSPQEKQLNWRFGCMVPDLSEFKLSSWIIVIG